MGSSPDEGTHLVGIWCAKIDSTSKCVTTEGTPKFSSKLSGDDSCYLSDADKSASCLEEQEEIFKDSFGPMGYGLLTLILLLLIHSFI